MYLPQRTETLNTLQIYTSYCFRANPTDCDHSHFDCHSVYNERDVRSKLDITSQNPLPQLLHRLLRCLGQEIELVILHNSSQTLTAD
jgi:hypothetical protein